MNFTKKNEKKRLFSDCVDAKFLVKINMISNRSKRTAYILFYAFLADAAGNLNISCDIAVLMYRRRKI